MRRIWGDDNFDYKYATSIGSLGGLITVWDKEHFQSSKVYCVNRFVAIEGR